ncbi:MAG: class I tRNA ligase family protein, partial [Candidatus Omnitrophica bacterium]|nr:class I tRNA ligase family protein [Candidatus Omnitrophota bacterium]
MPELSPRYNFSATETKWLKAWKDGNVFHAVPDPKKKPFTVVIPPPNVTGILHMGHAFNNTLQDILVRYKRMNGFCALWMPGTDHAGIATQNVVEKELAKESKHRQDLGRTEFTKRLWAWKQEYGDTIIHQLERLGSSCDWPRTRFTMDEAYSEAVKEAFVHLYDKGLIYRGERIINWCPRCQTALSDEEVEHKEKNGKLYHIRYPFKNDLSKGVIVATTRPETMLGDTAVAVHPKDKRDRNAVGQELVLPLTGRMIKGITDDSLAMGFGTGAVKVTPAHDP